MGVRRVRRRTGCEIALVDLQRGGGAVRLDTRPVVFEQQVAADGGMLRPARRVRDVEGEIADVEGDMTKGIR